jgi:hypothetical protein
MTSWADERLYGMLRVVFSENGAVFRHNHGKDEML